MSEAPDDNGLIEVGDRFMLRDNARGFQGYGSVQLVCDRRFVHLENDMVGYKFKGEGYAVAIDMTRKLVDETPEPEHVPKPEPDDLKGGSLNIGGRIYKFDPDSDAMPTIIDTPVSAAMIEAGMDALGPWFFAAQRVEGGLNDLRMMRPRDYADTLRSIYTAMASAATNPFS